MNKIILTKQMLEEQYSTVMKNFVECENDNLLLAQVCNYAWKDVNIALKSDGSFDELVEYVILGCIYNDMFHYYAGTTYGSTEEVRQRVKMSSRDKSFVEKMMEHAIHHLNTIAEAA